MKPFIILGVAAIALLSSCVTQTPQSRIDNNSRFFHSLSKEDKALIKQGEIRKDMSPEAVYLAWGAPSKKAAGNINGKPYESWLYHRLSFAPHSSFHSRYRYRRHSRYRCFGFFGGHGDYAEELAKSVEFRDDRVFRWEKVQ